MEKQELELQAVIGFKGGIRHGLILHPDNEHLIFPLGSTVVLRNLVQRTQSFLQGHDNQVSCISCSKSGNYLASGQKTFMGFQADIIIWDFHARNELHRLSLHQVEVRGLSFSYNELYLASLGGQDDNSLVVWEVKTGGAICGTPAATDTAHSVKFFNTSDCHLVTGGNYHVRMWQFDLANKKLRSTNVNLGSIRRITVDIFCDKDDEFGYCCTESGDLLEFSLDRGLFKRSAPKKCFEQGITSAIMIPNGDIIVGTGNGIVAKLAAGTLQVKGKCQVLGEVTSLAVTQDTTHFFCGTTLSNIYWVNIDSMTAELRNTCHHERINAVCFPAGYSEVFATCSCSDIRVWNSRTRQELLRIQVPNIECYCIDFSRDGKSLISGWSDGKIRAFTPQSGKLMYVINDAHKNAVTALKGTSDCNRIISGGIEGEVRIWLLELGKQTMEATMKEHRGRVWAIEMKADDTMAFTASSDGSCILWDLRSKTRSLCLFESTMFKNLVFHPDESQILTTGSDRKITYWDTLDGQAIRVVEGSRESDLQTLSISKSGSHFVSGGQDRVLMLWDYDEGICKYFGVGHSGTINSAAIAPDQSFIVSVGAEGAIFIWTMPEDVVERCHDTSAL